MAAQNEHWFVGTNQSTQGPKDPLPYNIKIQAMEAVWPEVKGHIVAETSWLTLASKIYNKYGSTLLNVYTDEDWVTKTLIQYNGVKGAHGFYNFKKIDQKPTPRLSSATALRAAVQANDRRAFTQAAGIDAETPVAGHAFFDVVKHYLMPHAEKAAAKPVKKKVKQPEQRIAEDDPCWKDYKQIGMKKKGGKQVPNCVPKEGMDNFKKGLAELSSDMLGRYKKAAGADASKADKAGDFEKGNKRFKGIVKATTKQFDNDMKGKK
jgi:hypothetical protein